MAERGRNVGQEEKNARMQDSTRMQYLNAWFTDVDFNNEYGLGRRGRERSQDLSSWLSSSKLGALWGPPGLYFMSMGVWGCQMRSINNDLPVWFMLVCFWILV